MKIVIRILFILLFLTGCKSSQNNITFNELETKNGKILEFKKSKCMIFDSLYTATFLEERRQAFTPEISTILYINAKLKKEYFAFRMENNIYHYIKPDDDYSRNEFIEIKNFAKFSQNNFDKIDKQYVSVIDSLGRKVISVNFVFDSEKKTENDLQNYFIGLYEITFNTKDSTFIEW